MNLSEANKLISKIEQNININEITIEGKCAWPIVRSVMYSMLATKDGADERKHVFSLSHYQYVRQISIILKKILFRRRISNGSSLKNNTQVVFLCRASHQVSVKGRNSKFDRVLDPIFNELNKMKRCQMFVLGLSKHRKYFFPKTHLARFPQGQKVEITGINTSGLEKQLMYGDFDLGLFKKLISRAENDFFWGLNSGRKLFKNHRDLDLVFISVWYSPESMGYIAAAHESGVKVAEVQHAAEVYNHPMYFGWQKTPRGGYEIVPDIFLMWNQDSADIVQTSFAGGRADIATVVGYPWHDFYKQYLSPAGTETSKFDFPIRILFTMQAPTFESKSRIPDFLIDFLKLNRKDVCVNFRCHPNDLSYRHEFKRIKKMKIKTQFQISKGDADLIDSINNCNFHITAFSTVCYEAKLYGVPTLLYGSEAGEYYAREIKAGVFEWTKGELADIQKFLCSGEEVESEPFLISSLDLLRRTLDKL